MLFSFIAWFLFNILQLKNKILNLLDLIISEMSMSTRGRNALKELEQSFSVLDSLYTLIIFVFFITLIPCIFSLYFLVATCRIIWLRFLEQRFPDLEFVRTTSVRTCVDTLRNQGIITLLLQAKGGCTLDQFKAQIKNEILDRVKDGRLMFPHLSMALTSRYGRYAWIPKSNQYFNIDNHIVLANPTFRARPVTSANIQEYVSDIVSKFLPPELPPWQITVINCPPERFYVLIRLHHLYLSEDNLKLGDVLMLKPATIDAERNYPSPSASSSLDSTQHLLAGTFKSPKAIPEVYETTCDMLANSWNEIVSQYDPLENVSINKKPPTLINFYMLFLITTVSAMKELSRSNKSDIFRVFKIEADRRGFTFRFFCRSVRTTLKPHVIICGIFSWIWWFYIKILLHIPVTIMHWIRDTPVYIYWMITFVKVFHEICYLGKIIYTGPRVLLEEIFFPENPGNSHHLQRVSLCGRKVICWSNPVSLEMIKNIRDVTDSTSCEITLSATAAALQRYFIRVGMPIPNSVITIARFIPQDSLLKQSASSTHSGGGLLCLPLPTKTPTEDPVASLHALQFSLYQARSHQAALYLASVYQMDYGLLPKVLPTVCARVLLNMLSRRYAVTLTQVDNTSSISEQQTRRLLWGQEVENIMYWRPPQANISMSLTLMSYGDSVRLGVMTDAQLSAHHIAIANDFCNHINELAVAVGVSSDDESMTS